MKRAALLAGLLVLALGAEVVAQSPSPQVSPGVSPEATPQYAPEDLTLTLPSRIGRNVVVTEDVPIHPDEVEIWRELLLPFGKEPEDVRQAFSMAFPKGLDGPPTIGDLVLQMAVFHVDGLPATMWMDGVITDLLRTGHLQDDYPYDEMEWRVVDGREVYYAPPVFDSPDGGNEDRGYWFYPKGEALFYINRLGFPVTEFTIEDVLAHLP